MQHIMSNRKQTKHLQKGFTLVEMLVVAPMVILLIGVVIGSIGVLTADSLKARAKGDLIYRVNEALNRIDQDVRLSSAFRDISFTPPAEQSANGSGAAFDTITTHYPTATHLGAILILRTNATDKNPLDTTRNIVYSTSPSAGACGTVTESSNTPLQFDIVYYLTYDTTTFTFTLWRRVIQNPSQTPCPGKTAWQRPSCAPGYTNTTVCKAEDEKILARIPPGGLSQYYARIPDRSWSSQAPFAPGNSPAPNHFIDCINPCQYYPPTSTNVYDPYSRDASNNPVQNAQQMQISLYSTETVAGETINYGTTKYSRRLNSL